MVWGRDWDFFSIYLSSLFQHYLFNVKVAQKCESCSLWPLRLYTPWNFPGQNTGVGSLSLIQGIFPTQRLNPGLMHCRWILYQLSYQGICIPTANSCWCIAEPQGKPKNTGVGSLFLLQRIFLTQESNWMHCRWVLYQLNYQGVVPFSCLQSFPASGSFQMSQFFASILRHSAFLMVQHSHLHMTTGKTIALTLNLGQ